ncbi:MAG: hypothetical protein ABR549_18525 [Mycobacteriales bacterium]
MSIRRVLAIAVLGSVALANAGAQAAGPPTLDGKKTKTLSATFSPKAQDNDKDFFGTSSDRTECSPDRCGRLPFVFKPAKGMKGNIAFTVTWSVPGEDFDLYVAQIAKDGSYSELTSCGAGAGTSEKVLLSSRDLTSGRKYALVVDFYRATGAGKVTGTVSFPGTGNIKTTVPAAAETAAGTKVNCGLG